MLRLNRETDYGLALLQWLLHRPGGEVWSARDLARETSLPLPMVATLLKRLAKHRILISYRGTRGGYALAGDSITVAAAVEALQGPISITTCQGAGVGDCLMSGGCPIVSYTRQITDTVRSALEGIELKILFEISVPTPPAAVPAPARSPRDSDPEDPKETDR